MIYLVFGPSLHAHAHEFARALTEAMNREITDDSRWAFVDTLQQPRLTFLEAAHAELD
jgi:hypothetical protein